MGTRSSSANSRNRGRPPYESGTALKTAAFLSPLNGLSARSGQLHSAVFSTMEGVYGVEHSAHNPWQTENGLFNDEVRRVFAEAD